MLDYHYSILLLLLLFVKLSFADSGDDFSNNLFSDLAPLLALFGERVTMQFLSQSMGWADCIILAMAPLGIITTIVSAIRVGGPSGLRALVGRSRENIATAEMELMSSTSKEACELWNGQDVVRCQGSAPIWEFICLLPENMTKENEKDYPAVTIMKLRDAKKPQVRKLEPTELNIWMHLLRWCNLTRVIAFLRNRRQGKTNQHQAKSDKEERKVPGEQETENQDAAAGDQETEGNTNEGERTTGSQRVNNLKKEDLTSDEQTKTNQHSMPSKTQRFWQPGRLWSRNSRETNKTPDPEQGEVGGSSSETKQETLVLSSVADSRKAPADQNDTQDGEKTAEPNPTDPDERLDERREGREEERPDQICERGITIIRNTDAAAPNINLNRSKNAGRGELYLVAVFGTILQIGVVLFFGFITYYPTLKFKKDGEPVIGYACPLAVAGTTILVLGMLLCGHVVDTSTHEQMYQALKWNKAQIVWLQQENTVSDQVFRSVALFSPHSSQLITTSSRVLEGHQVHQNSQEEMKRRRIIETKTIVGAGVCLSGFVIQFTGLRGMHWSASVAQLIAVGIMTILRAWVRRGFIDDLHSEKLITSFELDWLALTLGDLDGAPWCNLWTKAEREKEANHEAKGEPKQGTKESSTEGSNWTSLKILLAKVSATWSKLWNHFTTQTSPGIETTDQEATWSIVTGQTYDVYSAPSSDESPTQSLEIKDVGLEISDRFSAQGIMLIRRDLAKLADWRGPASAEAIRLTQAIEVAMNSLFSPQGPEGESIRDIKTFSWSLPVNCGRAKIDCVHFNVDWDETKRMWKAYADEIDAALSLWLYSVEKARHDQSQVHGSAPPDLPFNDDTWLRAKGLRSKAALRLLGSRTKRLLQDLRWWIPSDGFNILEATQDTSGLEGGRNTTQLEVEKCRVVGRGSTTGGNGQSTRSKEYLDKTSWALSPINQHEIYRLEGRPTNERGRTGHVLAVESYDSQDKLYAKDMFCAFMCAAAKKLKGPIDKHSQIQPSNFTDSRRRSWKESWKFFTLRSKRLSRLAQDLQDTGFESLHDAYLSIIPPMSVECKLPELDAIVEQVREKGREHEKLQEWSKASDTYRWLLGLAKLFPPKSYIYSKALAMLMEYLRAWRAYDELDPYISEVIRILEREPSEMIRTLQGELRVVDTDLLSTLKSVYLHQGRPWESTVGDPATRFDGDWDSGLLEIGKITSTHQWAYGGRDLDRSRDDPRYARDLNATDILEWTPLHYAAARDNDDALEILLDDGANPDAGDLRDWKPLHYACSSWGAECLIRSHAKVDAQGIDGTAPLHCMARRGQLDEARLLMEAGANTRLRDFGGRAPIHLAAIAGQDAIVEMLIDGAVLLDDRDRTPLHLAALCGQNSVVDLLIDKTYHLIDARDDKGLTPLHLATEKDKLTAMSALIAAGASVDVKDKDGRSPLHLAVGQGDIDAIKILVEAKADVNASDIHHETPLHWATEQRNIEAWKTLLEAGATNHAAGGPGKRTPLQKAANFWNVDALNLLIDAGAYVNAKSKYGQTPSCLELERRNRDAEKILPESRGSDEEESSEQDVYIGSKSRSFHKY